MSPENAALPLTPAQLAQLGEWDNGTALAYLVHQNHVQPPTVVQLAAAALTQAETDPSLADRWLVLATQVEAQLGNAAARLAAIAYAQARIYVHQGELGIAETTLRQAQGYWQAAGDNAGYSRSLLGLTQILAMQGRYAEAEVAARQAVDHATQGNIEIATVSETGSDPGRDTGRDPESDAFALLMRRVAAHHNLATLLLYQEQHRAALAEHALIRQLLAGETAQHGDSGQQREVRSKLAHSELNRATALTFLDQPLPAAAALQEAITLFQQIGDSHNLGRSRTNLGRLQLRMGQYAAALALFEAAFRDFLGADTTMASATIDQLRPADELLLEYAMACLVINLLPEAGQALAYAETLFRGSDAAGRALQPYELGQTRYTQGLLFLRTTQWQLAQVALNEATTIFVLLQNRFWLNRTRLAQAAVATARQQFPEARHLLDLLLETSVAAASNQTDDTLEWDVSGQAETRLLRLRLALETGDLHDARHQATLATALLQGSDPTVAAARFWPHLQLRLQHLLGKIAQAAGDYPQACIHFKAAITQLEGQRTTLVVEEIRSAFVNDKSELYADLVHALLAMAPDDSATIAEAFAVVEQARSRVLLERLLAAIDEAPAPTATAFDTGSPPVSDTELVAAAEQQRLTALREQLHWLYNQLLSESGSRRLNAQISRQLQLTEAALQQLEWRQSPLLAQSQSVDLAAFQQVLAPDQQAIVYAGVNQELLAFLVDRTSVQLYRRLTTLPVLQGAIDEFRFQMGRVEVDPAYVARHRQRLAARLQEALQQLYQLLLAPLAPALYAQRLLFVPFGPIHRLPLHALWDGARYLIERAECSYTPSASLAVFRQERTSAQPLVRWAGFALNDPAIPAARQEIEQVARHFTHATAYVDAQANRQQLWQAAAATDILHLATHGLFRPDNPFFSALKLADGWVDVRELYRLPLSARLVVLSACESGVGEITGGDEVVGLARGFLGAGREPAGRELVASLWNVHDATAATLMDHFYHYLLQNNGQMRPAAALRQAQRHALQTQQHPYYWAPFFVIGA